MKKFASIILVFFLCGCYTKCGLHYDYNCKCTEYYDASGQYLKECPDSLVDTARKANFPKNSSGDQIKTCPTPILGGASGACGN